MDDQGQKFEKRTVGGVRRFDRARRAVLKRIRAIAALPVLFALCASGIVLLLPDRYEASVTIQINPRQKLPVSVASGMSAQEIERHTIEGEIETLRSGAVVDHVIAALGLNRDPEFAPGWPAALIDRVLSLGSSSRTDTQAAVSNRLTVSRIRNTLLLDIRFSSSDPAKAARIANVIADTYLNDQVEAKWRFASSPLSPAHAHALSQNASGTQGKPTASERVFELPAGPLRPNATSTGRSHHQRCQAASRSSGARARSTRGAGRCSRAHHRHRAGAPSGVRRSRAAHASKTCNGHSLVRT